MRWKQNAAGSTQARSLLLICLVLVTGGLLAYLWRSPKPVEPVEVPPPPVAIVPEPVAAAPAHGPASAAATPGQQLYANYCAGCHGDKGDGAGPAARFVYPRPRNFGEGKYRIVTAGNRKPTDADLLQVITRGMPGSAMFAFGHLSEADRTALVGQVRTLMQNAFAEKMRREMKESGETVNETEVTEYVTKLMQADEVLAIPQDISPPTEATVAHGRVVYKEQCSQCHGLTGKGDGAQDQKNEDGMPTRPRDFTRGIFKGGREPAQIYARIVLGMPGSPMPAYSTNLKPDEIRDVIHFVLSMSESAGQAHVEHHRQQLTARKVAAPLGASIPATAWDAAPATAIVVSPLWWRDFPEPDLRVQALHDGQTLALRLSWHDPTRNESAYRPEDFEDMLAVQLFKGAVEPFLGMGAEANTLDLWQWRAGWHSTAATPDRVLDEYPFEGALYQKHATKGSKPPPDYLTARAAGNAHAHGNPKQTASNLSAKGFGTTTFRPQASQIVEAKSQWKDGRWTVEFRRPLQAPAGEGLSFAAGDRVSAAFAIWDGAARDRNGQKLVSIWHDLKIE